MLQAILVCTPWISIGGHPAILFDIAARRAYVFGEVFTARDTGYVVLLGLFSAFALFFFTSLYGRLWCGYACPQTVYLEEWVRPLERLIEGERGRRISRDKAGQSWDRAFRKGAKWIAFLVLSASVVAACESWFVGAWALATGRAGTTAYLIGGAFTLAMFLDLAWFREQFCNYLCPYARFQGALADEHSLVVAYDIRRGEPRRGSGDCTDCKMCVAACPQGIDIRTGFQLECIACARCIDACTPIMAKKGKVSLIGYSALTKERAVRPRTVAYAALLCAIFAVFIGKVATRQELQATIARPSGALYVVDLYRGLIQHRIYLTSYLRQQIESRNLQTPVNLGRIWRVVRDGQPVRRETLAAKPTTEELLAKLAHPNGWWRDSAQQMLIERHDASAVPRLRQLALVANNLAPLGRLHALWTLEGLGQLNLETLQTAIDDPDPKVRGSVLRLSEGFFKGPQREAAANLVLQRAGFIPLEEQLQLLFTLGEIRTPAIEAIMRVLLMNAVPSPLRFDAVISGLAGRELEFLDSLVRDPVCATMKNGHAPLLAGLARCVTYEAVPERLEHLLDLAATRPEGDWQQLALLDGIAGTVPLAKPGQPAPVVRPIVIAAESKALLALRKLESADVQQRVARLEPLIAWPGKPGMAALPQPAAPLGDDDSASFARGKALYALVCGACHQPHGNGQAGLAPPLRDSEWVLGSEQRLARIVLHGVRDEISVKGANYTLNMPALAEALTDEQLADALTYVRREWGHTAAPVKAATIKAVRTATAKREDSWTQAELLKVP